jgi:hypothetical protein
MKKTFNCACTGHILEIDYEYINDMEGGEVGIAIYDIYSEKTGRKLKKPKLIADVMLVDYPCNSIKWKELKKFLKFIDKVKAIEELQKSLRRII